MKMNPLNNMTSVWLPNKYNYGLSRAMSASPAAWNIQSQSQSSFATIKLPSTAPAGSSTSSKHPQDVKYDAPSRHSYVSTRSITNYGYQDKTSMQGYSTTSCGFFEDYFQMRDRLKELRRWEYTTLGRMLGSEVQKTQTMNGGGIRFTLMNYNVLAQCYLEEHQHLYKHCFPEALTKDHRFIVLVAQIRDYYPDVICLQEVEANDFQDYFIPSLAAMGYRGIFKKRTHDKMDGCACFWKKDLFTLVGKLGVDFYQPHVGLLNRDNIALMIKLEAKFGQRGIPRRFVVATTHLLFNPKRVDVKMAQTQLLLAELDRFCFARYGYKGEQTYLPTILCGDFNCYPHSHPLNLISDGFFPYFREDGSLLNLENGRRVIGMSMEFPLPHYLGISDQCVHHKLQLERFKHWKHAGRNLNAQRQAALINLHVEEPLQLSSVSSPRLNDDDDDTVSIATTIKPEISPPLETKVDPEKHSDVIQQLRNYGLECSFASGNLTHRLHFRNIYEPQLDRKSSNFVATTKQQGWVCVDFILQGMDWNPRDNCQVEGNLRLLRRLGLLTREQCKEMGPMPSLVSPSDHYPLIAEFLLK